MKSGKIVFRVTTDKVGTLDSNVIRMKFVKTSWKVTTDKFGIV